METTDMPVESPISISKIDIKNSPSPELVLNHGRLIVAGYKGMNPEDHPSITDEQAQKELASARKAQWVISAIDRNTNLPIALLAYSLFTPESAPEFYAHLAEESTPAEARALLNQVDGVFVTHEMVVAPKHRGNGVSREIREMALNGCEGLVGFAGEIQHVSSAAQRIRMDNATTVWAGVPLESSDNTPPIASPNIFIPAADALSRAFLSTLYPEMLPTYHNGIVQSGEFDTRATMPKNPSFQPSLLLAMRRIVDVQEQAPEGVIMSGMAITIADRRKAK